MRCYIFTDRRILDCYKISYERRNVIVRSITSTISQKDLFEVVTNIITTPVSNITNIFFLIVEAASNKAIACARINIQDMVLIIRDMWVDRIHRQKDADSLLLYCILLYIGNTHDNITQVVSTHLPFYICDIKDNRTMRMMIERYMEFDGLVAKL